MKKAVGPKAGMSRGYMKTAGKKPAGPAPMGAASPKKPVKAKK